MDFAADAVFDRIAPPARPDGRPAAKPAADTEPTFEDHLDAVTQEDVHEPEPSATAAHEENTPMESAASQPEAQTETPQSQTADAAPVQTPPVIAAPVLIQIAAAQPQTRPTINETPAAEGVKPSMQADADPAAGLLGGPETPDQTATAAAPVSGKTSPIESKPAQTQTTAPTTSAAPQTEGQQAPQQTAAAPVVTTPAASAAAAAPVAIEQLPPAVREAIAATIAPAAQGLTETAQRSARPQAQGPEAKPAATPNTGKDASVAPNAKTQTAKAVTAVNAPADIAATQQQAIAAPDTILPSQQAAATTTAAQASTHVQHAAAETGAQRPSPAGAQVAREIIRRFDGGNTSFELRLDPAELGRVEVRMEVSRDHRVSAVITADNPQALTELARHARELEQQLQSAGLQLNENGLSFDLRQGGQGNETAEASANGARGGEETLNEQQAAPVARPIGFERWRGVRVDMMV